MRLLLDTHAFLWFVLNDPALSPKARALIADGENDVFVSPATYWESEGLGLVSGDGLLSSYSATIVW